MKNERELCLAALIKMFKENGYSNLVLSSLLNKSSLNAAQKSYAARLFYGVLEKKNTLDYNISKYLKKPINKLDLEVLCVLRMGMYELLFMSSVPDRAAINESVNLCLFAKKSSAKGFVNAVLRAKAREGKKVEYPKISDKNYLSVRYNVSDSIVKLLKEQYKEETEEILKGFEDLSGQYLRVNTNKTDAKSLIEILKNEKVEAKIVGGFEATLKIEGSFDAVNLKSFKDGLFHVQDLSSQICVSALDLKGNESLLDVCAAPGGKSFTAAEILKDGKVLSCDLSQNRVSLIKGGVERLGLNNIEVKIRDAASFDESSPLYDRVLCDVLCSGLGVIFKKPEIRYKEINKKELFSKQLEILNTSSKYLKEGGILVYSTCTLNKCENEEVVDRFLEENREFSKYSVKAFDGESSKTLLPNKDNCDGFFACALIKKKEN